MQSRSDEYGKGYACGMIDGKTGATYGIARIRRTRDANYARGYLAGYEDATLQLALRPRAS